MSVCLTVCLLVCLQVSGVITDSAGVVRYVLSGTWDSKMEGANVLNGDDASTGKVEYITGQSKVLWQRRYPPYVNCLTLTICSGRIISGTPVTFCHKSAVTHFEHKLSQHY